jgi:hypothetical protein
MDFSSLGSEDLIWDFNSSVFSYTWFCNSRQFPENLTTKEKNKLAFHDSDAIGSV